MRAVSSTNGPLRLRLTALAIWVVVLALSALAAWTTFHWFDSQMREELLAKAQVVATAVGPDRVNVLNATKGDVTSPVYLRLKSQLAAMRAAEPGCRFVYLMGRRDDGTVFMYADSEPVGSKDESPAGQVYEEAGAAENLVFDTGKALTDGPMQDRWGTWVSGLVPIVDRETGAVLAMVGMDVDASAWTREVVLRTAVPVGLATLALGALILAGTLLLERRRRLGRSSPLWMGHLEPLGIACLGTVVTLVAAWLAFSEATRRQEVSFRQLAESRTSELAGELVDLMNVELEGLGRFYESSQEGTVEEFMHYSKPLTRVRTVLLWQWAQAVPEAQKQSFEQRCRDEGLTDFGIWQMDSQGNRVPAERRDVYYPVVRVAPESGHKEIGLDVGADPARAAAIHEAVRTGLPTAASWVRNTEEGSSEQGGEESSLVVFRPVFADPERHVLRGLVFAVLQPDRLLAMATQDEAMTMELLVAMDDVSFQKLSTNMTEGSSGRLKLEMHRPVLAFGRTFVVQAYAGPRFVGSHPVRAGVGTALAGLLLTAALAFLVSGVLRRRQQLETLVLERTADLRMSQEHLSATLRSMGDGVIACDATGRVTSLNPTAESLTGWTSSEAAGKPLDEVFCIVDANSGHTAENPVARSLAEGINVDLANHTLLIAKGGAMHHIADSCSPIRDVTDSIIGAVLVFRDVTEEYHSREEVRRSEQRLRQITDNTGEVIWLLSADDSRVLFISPAYERIWGRSCHSLYDDPASLMDAIHEEDADLVVSAYDHYRVSSAFDMEYRIVRPGGEVRWVHARSFPVRDASGNITAHTGLATDITQRKRAEEEKEKLTGQLMEARKMESVGRLAGGVAHDFNNLLQGIMNYADLAKDGLGPEHPSQQWLEEITQSALRTAAITKQLLAFARRQPVAPKSLVLNQAVEGVLKLVRRLMGADIVLTWNPEAELWPVLMDPGQSDQVLLNLCVNARDAIAGVGHVTIETENATIDPAYCAANPGSMPGEFVVLAVSDDGYGIDSETLPHIFEPFFSSKPFGQGTGLGLATVYGIVQQNGGFIEVTSQPGKGTAFRVYLPRHSGQTAQKAAQRAPSVPGGSETVLLVEDEEGIRQTTALFLRSMGYDVLVCSDPHEALQKVNEHQGRIHLLLTDVVMPGMSGIELAASLSGTRPDMKCLFISGYTSDALELRGIEEKSVLLLTKPFSRQDLGLKLRKLLDD